MKHLYILLFSIIMLFACKSNSTIESAQQYSATKKIVIYKTINDYSNYVPVIMNASKTEIISYPAPSDLTFNDGFCTPTKLKNGFLLDNKGINENVAFLKYTYSDYSKLKETPSIDNLMQNILEKYPLAELIYCESVVNGKTTIHELNQLIINGFVGCKKIEITALKVKL